MIVAEKLGKTYRSGGRPLPVLEDVNLSIDAEGIVAIVGPSGTGKTTLLGLLAGLDDPTTGRVLLAGEDIFALTEDGRAGFRARNVGFVFQTFHLLPTLTALENVLVPLELLGAARPAGYRDRARDLLERVGLGDRLDHYPTQLSGGEQQRVALARAFANRPRILFADEPTGNLDPKTGATVVGLMEELNREASTTLVLVTHDRDLAARAHRILVLGRGGIVSDTTGEAAPLPGVAVNGFPFRLAWWEGRASIRRVGLYGLSITLGVAALVAVRSFREDVSRSVREQARVLMGADAKFEADRVLPDSVGVVLDSLRATGARTSEVVRTVSMVSAPRSGGLRLLQVWSVDGDWPFYGPVASEPAGAWEAVAPGSAVVDRAVLTQLGVALGDSLTVGRSRLVIRGVVDDLPTDPGFQAAVGPRVWIPPADLEAAGLLGFGSLARWDTFLATDDRAGIEVLDERYEVVLEATGVNYTTADQRARRLTRAVGFLGRYLGLIGLGALLLGGIGVASAIHVFVKERVTQVAVLRCLGARQGGVFLAYLLQAAGLGFAGALAGVVLGVGVQQVLPSLLAGVLPVDVESRVSWGTALAGLGLGVWVATIFALLPLLAVRDVPPLRAFRQTVEGSGRAWAPARLLAVAALAASVVGLSIAEAPRAAEGVGFAVGLALATGALWLVGHGAIRASRRFFPASAPYPVRQGFSNLFRPGNQTISVTLALGFGAFIVGTVLQVQSNLGRELSFEAAAGQPNLLLFDVQPDQREGVLNLLPDDARPGAEATPLVSARLSAIDGVDVEALRLEGGDDAPAGWAVRREYRHTWRDTLTSAEQLVEGSWWPDADPAPAGVARISMETDLAADLGVGLGSELTWSVGGVEVPSVVTSLRTVDWDRFQTNFFVVFEPGPLDEAPASWVVLARVEGADTLAALQRDLVDAYPNVSALDLSRIQEAVESILGRAQQAAAFLAAFAAVAGLVVLAGALAASRHQRLREGALLKTLGARRNQLLTVFFSEYLALGILAALSGLALSVGAAWALVSGLFELRFVPAPGVLASVAGAVALLTVATGLLGSRGLLRRPPLSVLRDLVD